MAGALDSIMRRVSPQRYADRVAARARGDLMARQADKIRDYDGAAKNKRLGKWRPRNRSANTENKRAWPTLRARSRDLRRNNPYIARALDAITSHVVGTGIQPRIRSTGSSSVAERRARRVREIYRDWGETTACDADGRMTFGGLQSLVMDEVSEAGECLVRRRWRRPSDGVPANFQVQVLEADHLATDRDGWTRGGNRIVHGIEFDQIGNRVAYHLYDQHPGDADASLLATRVSRVPAEDVIHVFLPRRAGQVVGIPWTAPVMLRAKTLDDYEYAELVRQQIAACFVAFRTRQPSEFESDEGSGDDERTAEMTPGMIEDIGPDESVTFGSPPQPTSYDDFTKAQIRAIATGLGTTYEIVSGDLRGVNFTSGRMGRMEFYSNVDRWQLQMLIPQLCQGAMRWFLEAVELSGVRTDEIETKWTRPKRPLVEPHREIPAQEQAIRSCQTTLYQVLRERGEDPEEVLDERAEELEALRSRGIVSDSDPSQTTGSGGVADHDVGDEGNDNGGQQE